jgi:quinol monooxygenase YgiN
LTAPVRIVALWRARPDTVAEVRAILRELAGRTGREPGCRRFDVLEATRLPGSFVLLEEYADEQARADHVATGHFRTLVLERAVPLLAERSVEPYQPLDPGGGTP